VELECSCGATFEVQDERAAEWRCPACDEVVRGYEPAGLEEPEVDAEDADAWETSERRFLDEIGPAFRYPFRRSGVYALLGGSAFSLFVFLGSMFSPYGWLAGLGFGYLYSFLLSVLEESG
jgi:hypothetical protein